MSTHNLCLRGKIRNNVMWLPLLSRAMIKLSKWNWFEEENGNLHQSQRYTYTGEFVSDVFDSVSSLSYSLTCFTVGYGCPPSSKNLRNVNSKNACSGCLPFTGWSTFLTSQSEPVSLSRSSTGSKFDVSVACEILGTYGAFCLRKPSNCIVEKKQCDLISAAPFLPSLLSASQHKRIIKSTAG